MERVYKREGILFKILPCLLIAMYAIMCLFGSSVFAVSSKEINYTYFDGSNEHITITNDNILSHKYFFVVNGPYYSGSMAYEYFVIASDSPNITFTILKDSYERYGFKVECDSSIYYSYVTASSNSLLVEKLKSVILEEKNSPFSYGFNQREGYSFGYSNTDIYNNSGDLVFQGASQALATQIKTQVQGIQLQEVIQEIIQILPIILVVVVALIAIRKAILLLLKVLRNS